MSKEILQKQKAGYESQFKQAEQRLQQLAQETEQRTVQREQLRGAIFALDQVIAALDAPAAETPVETKKPLEVVKDEVPAVAEAAAPEAQAPNEQVN